MKLNLLEKFYKYNFAEAGCDVKLVDNILELAFNASLESKIKRNKIQKVFRTAKKQILYPINEVDPKDLLDLSNVQILIDIGANQLGTLNYWAEKFENINRFYAVDMIPQKRDFTQPLKSTYFQLDIANNKIPLENNAVDLINIQFVLHHLKTLEDIKKVLNECYRILKKEGSLVIWEESFRENIKINDLHLQNKKIGIQTDKELMDLFYKLSLEEKREFIILNDIIINSGNPHMPWTNCYYTWEEWIRILYESGFKLNKEYNLGLRINGKLKQGIHIIGEFKK